ncbi:MAG TPA: transposase [Ktedonobacteraceae bacterium]|nr:transposase [Ktedonobacteraceae bacterium]
MASRPLSARFCTRGQELPLWKGWYSGQLSATLPQRGQCIPIQGKIKTAPIKREGECWYVVFSCEIEGKPREISYEDVGIDLGIMHFAALSNGDMIDNPRHDRKAEKRLKKVQESLSHKKKGSHKRKKAVKAVAKAHRKMRNQRKDFHLSLPRF